MNQTINQQLAEIRNNMLAITQTHKENEVNTNQQTHATAQAGQTIQVKINPRGKGTMSAQVRKLMREQPQMSAQEIAKIVGCKPHTVHNVKYNQKKKRRIRTIQVKPQTRIQREITVGELEGNWTEKQTQDLLNRASRGRSVSELRLSLAGFILDMTFSGNTDLLKNKHFQNVLRITTPSEADQL